MTRPPGNYAKWPPTYTVADALGRHILHTDSYTEATSAARAFTGLPARVWDNTVKPYAVPVAIAEDGRLTYRNTHHTPHEPERKATT